MNKETSEVKGDDISSKDNVYKMNDFSGDIERIVNDVASFLDVNKRWAEKDKQDNTLKQAS